MSAPLEGAGGAPAAPSGPGKGKGLQALLATRKGKLLAVGVLVGVLLLLSRGGRGKAGGAAAGDSGTAGGADLVPNASGIPTYGGGSQGIGDGLTSIGPNSGAADVLTEPSVIGITEAPVDPDDAAAAVADGVADAPANGATGLAKKPGKKPKGHRGGAPGTKKPKPKPKPTKHKAPTKAKPPTKTKDKGKAPKPVVHKDPPHAAKAPPRGGGAHTSAPKAPIKPAPVHVVPKLPTLPKPGAPVRAKAPAPAAHPAAAPAKPIVSKPPPKKKR